MKHIYIAGPFFNEEEIANIEYTENILKEKGFPFFSPMRYNAGEEPGTALWARKIFETDRSEIEKADAVVALYYGNVSDSGTAWECGYAAAKGIPVILVHARRDADSNLMMHCGCATNIYLDELGSYDLESMPVFEYVGKMF